MYNNEKLILDLRLNYLNDYVEKFVIVESRYDHQGNQKEKLFEINDFFEYKNRIVHLLIDHFPTNTSNWEKENFQRNYIINALHDLSDEDYVMISM